ncbi:hypothetical protein IP510_11195 [Psychrobacter sp. NG254]|uniref:hypothetical protein n=1 Tax=Psychrobacter sp. NG254 TaxID=2782003 RepID=UPI0018886ACE|nr:hypothetical protein [Psychrobacter sp. NG254]MBF2720446.1 hypothetical protein [Psychrobacter sp. NG254]
MGVHQYLNKALWSAIMIAMLTAASGCSSPQADPNKQTIPTDSDQWQEQLKPTFEQLSKSDQQLLSRYMLRMKLSGAYESGAMPRTTIEQALIQQREYERLHPNNPTGKKSPIVKGQQAATANAQNYPIALLPVKTSDDDSLNQVKLQFMLSNHGQVAIQSFRGTLIMQDAKLTKGKRFNVPSTQFDPPIQPEQSGKIIIESSIEDINVMRAIKNIKDMTIMISEGILTLEDGQTVEFDESLMK